MNTKKVKTVTEILNELYLTTEETIGHDSSLPGNTPLVPSINFSTAYEYIDEKTLYEYHKNSYEYQRYSRDSNQNTLQLEKIFSSFFNGYSILFSSGMSAIWSVFWSMASEVDEYITIGSFYRKTQEIIDGICQTTGKSHINVALLKDLKKFVTSSKRLLIYIESPSNPLLRIADVAKIRDMFPNAVIVYDNTMAGLLNDKNPYSCVDFTIASCTKYIGGHNDIIGGVVSTTNKNLWEGLWKIRSSQGGILDSMSSYLLLRSLKTYDVRIKSILSNTEKILEYLQSSKNVDIIYYPGRFDNNNQREAFERSYQHGGGVVTFKTKKRAYKEITKKIFRSIKMAPSFGSTDTLIERPATMSHSLKSEKEIQVLGLEKSHIRLSVGMEPIEFIVEDLDRLLHNG